MAWRLRSLLARGCQPRGSGRPRGKKTPVVYLFIFNPQSMEDSPTMALADDLFRGWSTDGRWIATVFLFALMWAAVEHVIRVVPWSVLAQAHHFPFVSWLSRFRCRHDHIATRLRKAGPTEEIRQKAKRFKCMVPKHHFWRLRHDGQYPRTYRQRSSHAYPL